MLSFIQVIELFSGVCSDEKGIHGLAVMRQQSLSFPRHILVSKAFSPPPFHPIKTPDENLCDDDGFRTLNDNRNSSCCRLFKTRIDLSISISNQNHQPNYATMPFLTSPPHLILPQRLSFFFPPS